MPAGALEGAQGRLQGEPEGVGLAFAGASGD
jgi:hypothetical protein